MKIAQTLMVNASLHWSEYGVDDLVLWQLAVRNVTWLYNLISSRIAGLTPIKLFTKSCADH